MLKREELYIICPIKIHNTRYLRYFCLQTHVNGVKTFRSSIVSRTTSLLIDQDGSTSDRKDRRESLLIPVHWSCSVHLVLGFITHLKDGVNEVSYSWRNLKKTEKTLCLITSDWSRMSNIFVRSPTSTLFSTEQFNRRIDPWRYVLSKCAENEFVNMKPYKKNIIK